MMSNPQDRKIDPNRHANLSGYERMCRANNIVPTPLQVALARVIEEDEKNLAGNVQGRPSAADLAMRVAKELGKEEAAKTKPKSK